MDSHTTGPQVTTKNKVSTVEYPDLYFPYAVGQFNYCAPLNSDVLRTFNGFGNTGLSNLGNTCFMNLVLQCFMVTKLPDCLIRLLPCLKRGSLDALYGGMVTCAFPTRYGFSSPRPSQSRLWYCRR